MSGADVTGEAFGEEVDEGGVIPEQVSTRRIVYGILGSVGFLLIWFVAALPMPTYLLPSPVEVAIAFYKQLVTIVPYTLPLTTLTLSLPKLVVKLLQSLTHYLPGLFAGSVFGISLGIAMGWSGRVDDLLTPVTRVLRPIPPLAWIAFAIVWIGIGHGGAIFIVAIGAFWITFYNAYSGVEGVPDELTEVAATLGVDSDLRMIRKVVLPAASPEILTGIRTAIGQSWMIVVAAELFGAPGVGYEIINAAQQLALDISVAYMLVISIVFLASDALFRVIEGRILEWRA